MAKRDITVCIDAYIDPETRVFRIEVADDILRLLADAHETEFTIPELVDSTGAARSTVWRGVDLLESIGVVQTVLAVDQSEFHAPIRTFIDQVQTTLADAEDVDELLGIVVFGSVARGEADRQSDIDLFVVVDGDRTSARRLVTDVVADLSEHRFDGDRFEFEPYVESIDSATRAGSKLQEIFTDGITIYGGDRLQSLRKSVITDE